MRFGNFGVLRIALAASLLAGAAQPVLAQDAPAEPEKPFTVGGSATLVSDYRWRGYSLSNRDWAIQGSLQVTHKSGFFVGTWASSIAEVGAVEYCVGFEDPECYTEAGSTTEVDVYGGWSGPVGPVTVTGGVYSYLYPGADGLNIVELYGAVAYTTGPLTVTGGLNWAPDQSNLSRSNRYLFGTAAVAIPDTPLTVKATIGSEKGALVIDNTGEKTTKMDWLIGVDVSGAIIGLDPLVIGFAYSGNNLPDRGSDGFNSYAKNGFFVSIGAAF